MQLIPRVYLIILSIFLCTSILAQKSNTGKSYQLNPKKGTVTNGSFSCTMEMRNTEKGTLAMTIGDQNLKGIINIFAMEVATKDNYKKDIITREFVKKRRKTITEVNGQVMTEGDESGIEGKTAKFAKEKGSWKLQNGSDFSEFGLKYLNEFYDPTKKESEMIIYPDNLKVGETKKLTSKNFPKPSQAGETNTGSGTIKLLRIETVDGEKMAILELNFKNTTLHKIGKDQSKVDAAFKGIVRRSLRSFVDKNVNLEFIMNTTNSKYIEEGPDAIVKIGITGAMEATCEKLD